MKINIKDYLLNDTNNFIEIDDFDDKFMQKHSDKNPKYVDALKKDILSQVVRWQLAKKRSGNASTKTRSDVAATTRKPWAQKESGKARQGSLVGPHFRGGGVAFGPHPRSYEYKLNKKFKKLALGLALQEKLNTENFMILEDLNFSFSKTKDFVDFAKNSNLTSVLFVGSLQDSVKKSFSNVFGIDSLPLIGLNVLSCLRHKKIIFDRQSIEECLLRFRSEGV